MLRYVCFVLAVIGASAIQEPRKCCFDRQFTAMVGDVGAAATGTPHVIYPLFGSIQFAYDFYNKMLGTISNFTRPDGTADVSYHLHDYENRILYKSTDNVTCTYADMPPEDYFFDNCIPSNATYLGSSTFGYGSQTLRLNSWQMSYPLSNGETLIAMMSVLEETCVPVVRSLFGNFGGNQMLQTLFITDYSPGIPQQHKLTRPNNCVPEVTPTDPAVGRR